VSPHIDDAALSCAALLARPDAVDVLTVFAGEPNPPRQGYWDSICGFASSAESASARRSEDRAAFAGTPHRVRYLRLLEWQYAPDPRPAADADEIERAVAAWVSESRGGSVAVPAGAGWRPRRIVARIERAVGKSTALGRHPDHLFARDAALRAVASLPEVTPLLYEELPYVFGGRADREVELTASAWRRDAVLVLAAIDRVTKARRIAAYESQVPHLCPDGARLDVAANLPATERYWRLIRKEERSRGRASREFVRHARRR
jgi:LmbE family N-acetylglucosaminyl deacetylase